MSQDEFFFFFSLVDMSWRGGEQLLITQYNYHLKTGHSNAVSGLGDRNLKDHLEIENEYM